jgi:iron complex transport system substrate-binding protein
MIRLFNLILLGALIVSCTPIKKDQPAELSSETAIRYAQGFSVKKEGQYTYLNVNYPYQGASSGYQYILVPKGEAVPPQTTEAQVIEVPIERIVCTSTTHLPHLDYLHLSNNLVGFPTTDYVCSEKIRKRIDEGQVTDLGIDKGMNIELLYSLNPNLVMGYTMSADLGQLKKIQELNIPVVINAEYLEKSPLGRAEWIKFTALFFNKEKEADSVFRQIEAEYLNTKKLTGEISKKPAVLSGIVYGDAWFMPGGKNYAAQLLADAGCQYLWSDDSSNGYLELSFESVYEKAKGADLWIGVASFNSLAEMTAAEGRYALFQPFQNKKVYTYNARLGAKGGNVFLELGYLRPDLILKDLVKIAHPELLPDYSLYFHKGLE